MLWIILEYLDPLVDWFSGQVRWRVNTSIAGHRSRRSYHSNSNGTAGNLALCIVVDDRAHPSLAKCSRAGCAPDLAMPATWPRLKKTIDTIEHQPFGTIWQFGMLRPESAAKAISPATGCGTVAEPW